jgi:flagellar basal-body rod modification protein FlgD
MAVTSATDSIASLAAASASSSSSSTSDTQATSDRFLKLLVAQMQNQDPLSPMDNAEVTSQMAQINTVTGIQQLNTTMQSLAGQFAQLQALQGASLVGHQVVVPGSTLQVTNGVGQGGFELSGPADAVKVEVLSPAGQVIGTMQLGAQSSGLHSFDWNAGSATSTSGLRFRVTATTGGVSSAATTLVKDTVVAVSSNGGSFNLELANAGLVPYSSVREFD